MEVIQAQYESSEAEDDDDQNNVDTQSKTIMLAPNVDTTTSMPMDKYHDISTRQILHNPKADVLFGPIQGPLRQHTTNRNEEFKPNLTTLNSYVEIESVDDTTFNEQYHTFQSFGYAMNPSIESDTKYIGNSELLQQNKAMTIFNQSNAMIKSKKSKFRKRLRNEDPSDIDGYNGPWAPSYKSTEEKIKYEKELNQRKKEWALYDAIRQKTKKRKMNVAEEENECFDEEKLKERREREREFTKSIEKSVYHGTDEEMYDYQGRSYMHCADKNGEKYSKYYVPKKRIFQFVGHKDGVNSIQFLPKYGHLLLSASNDKTCKLWSINGERKCLRTFFGHDKGVRNVCFNRIGDRFLTTSYDQWIKLWDTETGKVIWRGTSGILAFSSKFYPKNENEFICGQKNKIAVQWDMRSDKIVQKYDEHLSAVNDVLFIDNNRRFATSSDDKKIFIWDYGTPVVIKHISEPHLHSTPFLKLHPNKKWFLGQSMDNKIVCYSALGKIGRPNAKKMFDGHLNAGYSCQVDVSGDGNIVMSGDAKGFIYFWDWKTCRFLNKIQCHKKVTMGAVWHPVKASLVATCSWDATIFALRMVDLIETNEGKLDAVDEDKQPKVINNCIDFAKDNDYPWFDYTFNAKNKYFIHIQFKCVGGNPWNTFANWKKYGVRFPFINSQSAELIELIDPRIHANYKQMEYDSIELVKMKIENKMFKLFYMKSCGWCFDDGDGVYYNIKRVNNGQLKTTSESSLQKGVKYEYVIQNNSK